MTRNNEDGELSPSAGLCSFTKTYGRGKKRITACSNVSMTFTKGSVTGLLGPNGAGKTTILKALCGIHYPSEGSVYLDSGAGGRKTEFSQSDDLSYVRQHVGYVPETPTLDPHLTVLETLYQSALIHGLAEEEAEDAIAHSIVYADLSEVLNKKVGLLSKGYMQRTSFARALSYDPPVLVLDEFTDGLDPAQIVRMRTVIRGLAGKKAVLLSTHHIDEAVALCDSAYILSNGIIVANGRIDEILAQTHADSLEHAFLQLTSGIKSAAGGAE